MRTNMGIPANQKRKLTTEAASKHVKGFSRLIIDALEKYFSVGDKEWINTIAELKYCMNNEEHGLKTGKMRQGVERIREHSTSPRRGYY